MHIYIYIHWYKYQWSDGHFHGLAGNFCDLHWSEESRNTMLRLFTYHLLFAWHLRISVPYCVWWNMNRTYYWGDPMDKMRGPEQIALHPIRILTVTMSSIFYKGAELNSFFHWKSKQSEKPKRNSTVCNFHTCSWHQFNSALHTFSLALLGVTPKHRDRTSSQTPLSRISIP